MSAVDPFATQSLFVQRPWQTGSKGIVMTRAGTQEVMQGLRGNPVVMPQRSAQSFTVGPPGVTGSTGPNGVTGTPGGDGNPGLPGATGPVGPGGLPGVTGPTGPGGPPGDLGTTGPPGPSEKDSVVATEKGNFAFACMEGARPYLTDVMTAHSGMHPLRRGLIESTVEGSLTVLTVSPSAAVSIEGDELVVQGEGQVTVMVGGIHKSFPNWDMPIMSDSQRELSIAFWNQKHEPKPIRI